MINNETYICTECKKESPRSDWRQTEMYCETCGEHFALQCPRCLEVIDMVFHGDEYPNHLDVPEGHYRAVPEKYR